MNIFSCDRYYYNGLVAAAGARCRGDYQHCTWPWYRLSDAWTSYKPSCLDKPDQVFPINTTCRKHNKQFLETYRTLWCSGNDKRKTGYHCNNLDDWFSKRTKPKFIDPHGCERSCSTPGPNCLACDHDDFFHCNSTGFCINKENVCDGHPHPSCGGDYEDMDKCLEIYFKKRIVKRYATLICPSKMYPGNMSN